MRKRGRPPKAAKQEVEAVGEGNKSMADKQERDAVGKVNDSNSKAVKQPVEAAGEVNGSGGDSKTNRFRGVRMTSSGRFSAEFGARQKNFRRWLGTFNTAEEAACAYDLVAVSCLGPKAKTNFPLPPISSSPKDNSQDLNPNFNPEPCLQDQHQILRPRMPSVSGLSSTVESISEHKQQLEQLDFLQKMRSATPKAQNQTFMAQSAVPEPTTIIPEHQNSPHDGHHKKKKSKTSKQHSKCHSPSEIVEVRPDIGVGASPEGSTRQGQPVPSFWNLGHVEPLETSGGANIMHSSDNVCPNWSLKINDRACDPHVVTELNEGSVLPRYKIPVKNLPDGILHEQLQAGLANVCCVEMEVLRRFKESNVRLQRISKERDDLALHSKEQETKLRKLEAELELCKSELSQSKTELEQTEIEMEIELGAAKHEMAEIEARHQAVLNEVEAKHKAALSKAAEMAVKDFKRSKACEDDLVALIAPAYGMGFTEALDLAKSSGTSIDLSREAFARTYQPGSRDELMRRVALFKEGKDLSEFYQIAGQAEGEQVAPERSGDETAEDNAYFHGVKL